MLAVLCSSRAQKDVRGLGGSLSNCPILQRYVGIDYSGAETPTSSLKGLRVYTADREKQPVEIALGPKAAPISISYLLYPMWMSQVESCAFRKVCRKIAAS